MKATDFNMAKDIKFDFEKGITTFQESRLVIFDAEAIGLLRQKLIEEKGMENARAFFLQFGYQNGYSDFMRMKKNYTFDSEMEMLASGPVIHTWEGVVNAKPTAIKFDREKGEMFFTGIWTNSYEAEQHVSFNGLSKEPVCWSVMGYASGWTSAFFGSKVIAIEPVCTGKGDDHCEWKIQPPAKWGKEADVYVRALEKF